jgi:hypothetical protein
MTGKVGTAYGGRRGVTPFLPIKLDIILTLRSLFTRVRPLYGGWASECERLVEEKDLPSFPETETRIVEPVAQSLYLLSYRVPIMLMLVVLT